MFQDFMISTKKAKPEVGAEVHVRLKDTHTVTDAVYRNDKFVGIEVTQPVISWIPVGEKCSCEKLRWKATTKKGKCKSCGTVWL